MPHNFDYVVDQAKDHLNDDAQRQELEATQVGPDSDEVWDVLDIYAVTRWMAESHSAQPARYAVSAQVHTGAADMILNASDLDSSVNESAGQSHRVLWADGDLGGFAGIQDDTNGEGSSPVNVVLEEHLRFDEGDLRIEFPGELSLGWAVDNSKGGGVSGVDGVTTLAVHYIPQSRHR